MMGAWAAPGSPFIARKKLNLYIYISLEQFQLGFMDFFSLVRCFRVFMKIAQKCCVIS